MTMSGSRLPSSQQADRPKLLAINGSYRDGGITAQLVDAAMRHLDAQHWQTEVILLRDYPINFCLNCRHCMQTAGTDPGSCVHADDMAALIAKIEAADAYILASPTNFGSVTALFKRFMERLAVYGYWPWGRAAPVYRKRRLPQKAALLISSCAAPGMAGRLCYSTGRQLRLTARTIGARPVGLLFAGLSADQPNARLPPPLQRKVCRLADRLHKTATATTPPIGDRPADAARQRGE